MRIGEIAELWLYPVKSMRGQRVASVWLDSEGLRGDRHFAFASSNAPAGKPLLSSRERAVMLLYNPETAREEPMIRTPHGDRIPLRSVNLLQDFTAAVHDKSGSFTLQASPERPLTDVRPVSLVSLATLAALSREMGKAVDPQRFRSNIILRLDEALPFAEDAWSGRMLRFGTEDSGAELQLRERIPRCRMVSFDPQTAEPENTILKHLARSHEGRVGVYATVHRAGMLEEKQPILLL